MCLNFEISFVLLLRMLLPLNNAISSFSFRQVLPLSDDRLKRGHFLRILHLIWGTEFLRFIFQSSFESSVSFLYADKLNSTKHNQTTTKTIEQRLSNNSSNETIFNEAAPLYEKALSEAGYNVKLKYNLNKKTKQKKQKKEHNMV